MNQHCDDYLERILSGSADAETEAHLRNCEECRVLAEEWTQLKSAVPEPETVPSALDAAVLQAAHEHLKNRTCRNRILHWSAVWRFSTAAAAAAAVMAGVFFWSPGLPESKVPAVPQVVAADWTGAELSAELAVLSAEADSSVSSMNLKGSALVLAQLESDSMIDL